MELNLALATVWYAVFIVSLTFHEAAHAFAALKFGDPTAYYQGQVTLDPIPHIRRSPFGMVIVPIVSFILGGWMIGWASAPYDPYWADSNRRKAALMGYGGTGRQPRAYPAGSTGNPRRNAYGLFPCTRTNYFQPNHRSLAGACKCRIYPNKHPVLTQSCPAGV